MGQLANVYVSRRVIERTIEEDESAVKALLSLDIDPFDLCKLGKILDHNHSGVVNVIDMLNGLQRMRGTAKRRDTISVELVLEGVQEQLYRLMLETESIDAKEDFSCSFSNSAILSTEVQSRTL